MRVSKQGAKEVPVAEKTAPVKKAAPVKKTKPASKAKPAVSKETVSDSFQAARRVWPD